MLELNNCYKVLHLEEDCSDLQLRQQYRKFALEMHPDRLKAKKDEENYEEEGFVRIS
jgi:curved DNA-binding protein CbpA